MSKARRHLDLAKESLGSNLGGDVWPKNLYCNRAVMTEITREKNNRHASFAEGALNSVAAGETRFEALLQVVHESQSWLVDSQPARASASTLDEILQLVAPREIAGIVATNTTITRPETANLELRRVYSEPGGLSGKPLRARSTEVIRYLYRQTRGDLPIIGVGGIFSAADAWEKIAAGASLVQVYTGLVYEGPGIAREIVNGLRQRLAQSGLKEIQQAVGSAAL